MNLDDLQAAAALDAQGMAAHIDGLPQQLQAAWQLAQRLPLPAVIGVQNIVICGMGGSAIGGALLQALVAEQCTLPIISVRDYQLPERVRELVLQGRRDRVSTIYERLTREYYRRLAEEASR